MDMGAMLAGKRVLVTGASSGLDRSISSTMRLPTTTASANVAMRAAVSPSRMPKPTPTGTRVFPRMRTRTASTSAASMFEAPLTPLSDT